MYIDLKMLDNFLHWCNENKIISLGKKTLLKGSDVGRINKEKNLVEIHLLDNKKWEKVELTHFNNFKKGFSNA